MIEEKPYIHTRARAVYIGSVIVGEYLRESSKNIGTTKLFGGFNILLYEYCSHHKYSVAHEANSIAMSL